MRVLGVIPARYESTRFPGKPLVDIKGKSMIRHVYENCMKSLSLDDLIVATDDLRIYDEVKRFSGKVTLTSPEHLNGTERCAEVAENYKDYDYIVNIQGDEPLIDPAQVDKIVELLDGEIQIATLIKKVDDPAILHNPAKVKAVINKSGEALYFSRQCIPYVRGVEKSQWLKHHSFYKHIGIYAYRRDVLMTITKLPPTFLETTESLEQLRWLENGYRIQTALTDVESQNIDTPEDLKTVLKTFEP